MWVKGNRKSGQVTKNVGFLVIPMSGRMGETPQPREPFLLSKAFAMKLIIQIPCFNEEQTLPQTLADLPTSIDGIDEIEVMIIDDGSTDRTVATARALGVDHIIRHGGNRGLAAAFATGIQACLQRDADIIVNTDGDNQYCGADIVHLVTPLLRGEATIVLGDRQTGQIDHFSQSKKILQRVGSCAVRQLSGTDLNDAVSGFRAFTREAALQINIVTDFSYTIETLIQAGAKKLPIASVPVRTNPKTRESRLFRSLGHFMSRQVATMFRSYMMYHPAQIFLGLALLLAGLALIPLLILFAAESLSPVGTGVIGLISGVAFTGALTAGLLACTADLQRNNRRLIEMVLQSVRQIECDLDSAHPLSPSRRTLAVPESRRKRNEVAKLALGAAEAPAVSG